MSSNRPMFDDEDLPAWLKNAGITFAGRHSTPSTQSGPPSGEAGVSGADSGPAANMPWSSAEVFGAPGQPVDASLPWTTAEPSETPPAAAPADVSVPWSTEEIFGTPPAAAPFDTSDVSLPWSSDEAAAPAPSADLPWAGGVTGNMPSAPPPDVRLPGTGELPWLDGPVQPAAKKPEPPDKPAKGVTDYLPWRQGMEAAQAATDQNAPEPMPWDNVPSAPPPAAPADDEWLQAISAPEDESQNPFAEDQQAQPAPGDNWLDSFSLEDEAPAQAGDQDVFDFTPEADEETPVRRPAAAAQDDWFAALSEEDKTPTQPAASDDSWLDDALLTPPASPDESTQPNRPTLPRRLPSQEEAPEPQAEAVPDWLTEDTAPASKPPEPAEDVPDWFKDIAASGPAATPAQPDQPPQSVPSAEPERLAGTGGAVDDLDFETLFGAKETSEPKPTRPEPAQPPAPSPALTPADDEMLDWMAEPPPDLSQAAPAAPPAWLSQSVELPKSAAPAAPGEESLDWMESGESDLVGDIAEDWLSGAPPRTPEPVKNDESDIPEWMRGMAPPEPQPATGAAPDADLALDWLENIEAPAETTPAPAEAPAVPPVPVPSAAPAPADENLDLNFDLSSADIDSLLNLPPSGALVPVEEPEPEPVNLDESLDFDQLMIPEAEAPAAPPEPVPAKPAAPAPPVEKKPFPEPAAAKASAPAEVMPEWVSDMRPADAPVALHIGDQEVRIEQTPLSRLNNQLRQLRERVKNARRPVPAQPTPDSGPLSGISGALPPAADVLKPAGGSTVAGAVVGDLQARRMTLLQNILSIQDDILRRRLEEEDAEPEAGAPARARRKSVTRSRFKPDRVLVTLVLALVLIAPFFTGVLNLVAVPTLSALPQDQRDRFEGVLQVVNNLQVKQPVLMAFEFGPTAAGELDDLAEAVLRDLFRIGALPVIVSSNPSGAMHAQELVTRLAAEGDEKLVARQDYVILRYLPGGAAGVRAMVNALQQPGFQRQVIFSTDIEGKTWTLDDAGLLALRSTPAFVLTETQDDVRNWAEQYRSALPGETLRLVLLSSASAAAAAQSYASSGASDQRILGPLVGVRDAMLYRTERKQFTTDKAQNLADQRWQSMGVSALFAAVIILFGAAFNMVRSLARRRSKR